jgi:hypothetical protein
MVYQFIVKDKTVQLVQVTAAIFKKWKVWKVRFNDGREAMLYKLGGEWIQRNEDNLTAAVLTAIGSYIDEHIKPADGLAFG